MKGKLGVLAVAPLLAGCGFALGAGVDVYHEDVYYEDAYYRDDAYRGAAHARAVYVEAAPARFDTRWLPVARHHLPRAGRCRVWLPGLHPSRQARSGSCRALGRRVPPGGWLLVRPRRSPDIVELVVHDARGIGVRTRYVYDVRTGRRVNRF